MRISQLAAVAAAGILLAGSTVAICQSSDVTDRRFKLNGYVDLRTGLFHPGTQSGPIPARSR
jgi:hypothetical protein